MCHMTYLCVCMCHMTYLCVCTCHMTHLCVFRCHMAHLCVFRCHIAHMCVCRCHVTHLCVCRCASSCRTSGGTSCHSTCRGRAGCRCESADAWPASTIAWNIYRTACTRNSAPGDRIIGIHHEYSCRIRIYHPMDQASFASVTFQFKNGLYKRHVR